MASVQFQSFDKNSYSAAIEINYKENLSILCTSAKVESLIPATTTSSIINSRKQFSDNKASDNTYKKVTIVCEEQNKRRDKSVHTKPDILAFTREKFIENDSVFIYKPNSADIWPNHRQGDGCGNCWLQQKSVTLTDDHNNNGDDKVSNSVTRQKQQQQQQQQKQQKQYTPGKSYLYAWHKANFSKQQQQQRWLFTPTAPKTTSAIRTIRNNVNGILDASYEQQSVARKFQSHKTNINDFNAKHKMPSKINIKTNATTATTSARKTTENSYFKNISQLQAFTTKTVKELCQRINASSTTTTRTMSSSSRTLLSNTQLSKLYETNKCCHSDDKRIQQHHHQYKQKMQTYCLKKSLQYQPSSTATRTTSSSIENIRDFGDHVNLSHNSLNRRQRNIFKSNDIINNSICKQYTNIEKTWTTTTSRAAFAAINFLMGCHRLAKTLLSLLVIFNMLPLFCAGYAMSMLDDDGQRMSNFFLHTWQRQESIRSIERILRISDGSKILHSTKSQLFFRSSVHRSSPYLLTPQQPIAHNISLDQSRIRHLQMLKLNRCFPLPDPYDEFQRRCVKEHKD
uniref:Uncharacterized protein n=1 Tax=Glossina pallidipes TaxID=7398 RepID=A0A1A9Z8B6_GLOPL